MGSVSFRLSRRKELQLCTWMRAGPTERLGSLRPGEACLTSAPPHSLEGPWTSLLNRRVWGDFLRPVHCLEVTISSKVLWHTQCEDEEIFCTCSSWERFPWVVLQALCFNRLCGLREVRRGSFFLAVFAARTCCSTTAELVHWWDLEPQLDTLRTIWVD